MSEAAAQHSVVQALAERAERDAARWEAAAVEMERQRNVALKEKREALDALADGRARMVDEARLLIGALDDLARRVATTFEIHLPERGCDHDEWPD